MNPGFFVVLLYSSWKLKLKLLYLTPPIFIRESKFELSTFCLEITLLSSTLLYAGDSLIFLPVQFSPATSSNILPILPSLPVKFSLKPFTFYCCLKKKTHENLTTVYYFSQSSAVLAGFLLYLMLTDSKQAENTLTHKTSWCWLAIGSPAEALSLGTWVSLLAGFLHSLSCEFSMCLSWTFPNMKVSG